VSVSAGPPPWDASFRELYRRHARDVYRFALFLSGDPALAEDITAETFLRVWQRPSLRWDSVRPYLLAIARNLLRHERRRLRRLEPLDDKAHPLPHDDGADRRVELQQVLARIDGLPEGERAALVLRVGQGLAYQEVAAVLGISTAAAKVRVHRARLRLAEEEAGACEKREIRRPS
jgi:RNA polymerase sigma-70 factor, ECF subfamily